MEQANGLKIGVLAALVSFTINPIVSYAADAVNATNNQAQATIVSQIFDKAKKNDNWKTAVVTGKDGQVVFMNVTPKTNPKNEIGLETHKFDQVIFVVQGQAKAILNDKNTIVKQGDVIFIPQGTAHNFINTSMNQPFKIISVYTGTDIPANAAYKTMADMPADE